MDHGSEVQENLSPPFLVPILLTDGVCVIKLQLKLKAVPVQEQRLQHVQEVETVLVPHPELEISTFWSGVMCCHG